jgi:hypothetical protein
LREEDEYETLGLPIFLLFFGGSICSWNVVEDMTGMFEVERSKELEFLFEKLSELIRKTRHSIREIQQ